MFSWELTKEMSKQYFSISPRTHTSKGRDVYQEVTWHGENAALSAFYYNSKLALANVLLAQTCFLLIFSWESFYDMQPFILSTINHWGIKPNSGEHKYIWRSFWQFRLEHRRNIKDVKFKNTQIWNCSEHLTTLFHGWILSMILSRISQCSISIIFYPDLQYDRILLNKKKKYLWKQIMISENIW